MEQKSFQQLSEDERKRLSPAIWNFSSALLSLQEYKAYESSFSKMNQDAAAQKDLTLFQEKQQEINRTFQQNGNREAAVATLEESKNSLMKNEAIFAYTSAQDALSELCREANVLLSKNTGLDFVTVCAPSCCG